MEGSETRETALDPAGAMPQLNSMQRAGQVAALLGAAYDTRLLDLVDRGTTAQIAAAAIGVAAHGS